MNILSLHTSHHDANFCTLKDGSIINHNEIERFTRIKHDGCFSPGFTERLNKTLTDSNVFDEEYNHISYVFCRNRTITSYLDTSKLKGNPQIHYIGHHTSHASSVYYNSNFDNALIFSIDGGGEEYIRDGNLFYWYTYSNCIFLGEKNKITMLSNGSNIVNSIGGIWMEMLEKVFGMSTILNPKGDEAGTLMAMAALGDPYKYLEEFRFLVEKNSKYIRFEHLKNEIKKNEENRFHIAASLQRFTEDFMMNYIIMNLDRSDTKNICFTGGVSLNCVALGKIAKALIDRGYNVFCDQAPNDSGLSLGAAKYLWHHILGNPRNIEPQNSYLGRTYTKSEINESLNNRDDIDIKENVNLSDVVELLMGSKIISLFIE